MGRCLPDMGTLRPARELSGSPGTIGMFAFAVEHLAVLCCQVLTLAPQSVEAPGPQHSLTRHLKSTGFLAYLCLPALSEVHGRLSLQGRNVLTGRREAINFAADLLQQVRLGQLGTQGWGRMVSLRTWKAKGGM